MITQGSKQKRRIKKNFEPLSRGIYKVWKKGNVEEGEGGLVGII